MKIISDNLRNIFFLLFMCLLAGCKENLNKKTPFTSNTQTNTVDISNYLPGANDESYLRYQQEAALIAASMEDKLLAAQVLISGIDGRKVLSADMKAIFTDVPVGGIIFFKYNLNTSKDEIKSFLNECYVLLTGITDIAPFLAVDHEGGLVHRFGEGVEKLPPAFYYWELAKNTSVEAALNEIETSALRSAHEIRSLGFNMNFAPVAEILNDENALFLESRSYGPDLNFVKNASSAFIRSMDTAGIVSVVKHFPGNASADPHFTRVLLDKDRNELDRMVSPFAGIITQLRPPAILVSHTLASSVDAQRIASLSPLVMQTWLRDELGFKGIIITDDFSMQAAQQTTALHAEVEALIAGTDMLIVWPSNLKSVHREILKALNEGSLPRERLIQAVEKIITEKLRYGWLSNEQRK